MKILFADDDPILREFAAVHLATETQEVRLAGDGEEALAMLADPRLAQVPVMVITGREDVRAIDQAFHLGATAFLTKPINWRLLSYQILYVHRASLAEASLRSGGLEGEESQRALVRAVARLAEESRSLLREVEQEGGSRLKTAAFRYRSALAEVVASAAA